MKTIVGIGWAILSCLMLISCSSKQTSEGEVQNVPLVILDVDIPSSTDDMFALQMLYKYADAGKCKILGVVVDRVGVAGAGRLCVGQKPSHQADLSKLSV